MIYYTFLAKVLHGESRAAFSFAICHVDVGPRYRTNILALDVLLQKLKASRSLRKRVAHTKSHDTDHTMESETQDF